jgi:hypothetical protein
MNRWKSFPSTLGSTDREGAAPAEQGASLAHRAIITLDGAKVLPAIIAVASNAWKAKVRLSRLDSSTNSDIERMRRHLDAIAEALATLGLEIKDHTGEPFDYGQSLKVAASQPKEGISREFVSETIRPTIYLNGVLIQQGEVVIDTPIARGEE